MQLFTLKLDKQQTSPPDADWSEVGKRDKIELPEGKKDFATLIDIEFNEENGKENVVYNWKETEIRYKAYSPQTLHISLSAYTTTGADIPRFSIHDIRSTAPIVAVHYLTSTGWQKFNPYTTFPASTYQIRLTIDMPRNRDTHKVHLIVLDNVSGKEIDCDPLVGNDPP
jgi:hypothetical protein